MRFLLLVSLMALLSGGISLAETTYSVAPDSLLHKTYLERMHILADHYTGRKGSDVFRLEYVAALQDLAQREKDEGLLWESKLILGIMYLRCYESREECSKDTVVSFIEDLAADARSNKVWWLEAQLHCIMGSLYFNRIKNHELGIEHFALAVELLKDVPVEQFPMKSICLHELGTMYYKFQDYESARDELKEAIASYSDRTGDTEEFYRFHSYNTLGLCYQKLGLPDSADYCFQLNLERSRQLNDESRVGLTLGNMGHSEYQRKRYDKAVPLLEEDLRISLNTGDWGMASNAAYLLGKIALEEGDVKSARDLVYQSLELAHKQKDHFEALGSIFHLLSKIEISAGNADLASAYLDSSVLIRDSAALVFSSLHLDKVKQRIELEKVSTTLDSTARDRQILMASLSIAIVVAALLFGGFQLASRKEKERLLIMKEIAEMELRQAELELNDFMESFKMKSNLLEETRSELEALKVNVVPDEDREEFLEQLQSSVILTEQDWREFQDLFEKVHIGFFVRLRDKIPGLTQSETRFLTLKRLRLSNKEMAAMLGVGNSTIRSLQSRLMPKLPLEEDQSIEEFVRSV